MKPNNEAMYSQWKRLIEYSARQMAVPVRLVSR